MGGLWLLTLVLPWVVVPGVENPYLEPKALLLTAGGWGLILWRMFRRPTLSTGWHNPWTVWVAGWVVGVSCWKFQWLFLHRLPGQSRIIYNEYVWFAAISVVMALLLAEALTTSYLTSEIRLQRVTQWMVVSATLASVYALCQGAGFDQWYPQTNSGTYANRMMAGFGNPGYLAIYLALILPLCFLFAPRRYVAAAALIIFTIFLSGIRYAWVIAGVGVGASLLARWWGRCRLWQRLLSLLLTLGALLGGSLAAWPLLQADEMRLPVWSKAVALLQTTAGMTDHPRIGLSMTGYGLNSLPILLGEATQWAHNEWVQMAVEIGLIGTALVAAMVWWATRVGWQRATQSLLVSGWFGVWIAFLVTTLIHFPGHIAPIAWVGVCAWAVMERVPEGV